MGLCPVALQVKMSVLGLWFCGGIALVIGSPPPSLPLLVSTPVSVFVFKLVARSLLWVCEAVTGGAWCSVLTDGALMKCFPKRQEVTEAVL